MSLRNLSPAIGSNGMAHAPVVNGSSTAASGAPSCYDKAVCGSIVAEWKVITPEMAYNLLTANVQNRDLKPRAIKRLRCDLENGHFKTTHQAIAIDRNNTIIDGQHRLTAIFESGIPAVLLVVSGLDPEVRSATDLGTQRSPKDQYQIMKGDDENAGRFTAIVKMINACINKTHERQAWESLEADCRRYALGFDWLKTCDTSRKQKWESVPVLAALVYAYATAPQTVTRVRADLESGLFTSQNDPVLLLRDFANESPLNTSTRPALFYKTLNAVWNRHHSRPVNQLRVISPDKLEFFTRAYKK